MALPTLNWKMLSPVFVQGQTTSMAAVLDAIYTMGTATTYSDGSARTPGSGSAWTWGRDTTNTNNVGVTTACYGTPPLNPGLGQKILLAGSANAATPTMITSPYVETWNVNTLLLGLCKNAGAYNNANPASNLGWRDSNPFTTGQFTGFIRASILVTSLGVPVYAYMWESQEAIVVLLVGNTSSSVLLAGALIDPLSSGALNAETDGRLYSIMTPGGTAMTAGLYDYTLGGTPFTSPTAANLGHCYTLNVGNVATVRNTRQSISMGSGQLSASMLYTGGERPLGTLPFFYISPATPGYAGQSRQFYWSTNAVAGQELRQGATVVGYTISNSLAASNEVFVLTP